MITGSSAIRATEPLSYIEFMNLVIRCTIAITDSGGLQEETTYLGIPCATLRENTERPITVSEGTNTVVGREPKRIQDAARRVLQGSVERRRPALWDGKAGERIADALVGGYGRSRARPT